MKLITLDKRIFNVGLLFILAYTIVHLLYLLFVLVCANLISIENVTYYFSYVSYNIAEYEGWTRMRIVILYGLPTFLMLLLAGIFYVAMKSFSFADAARQKLFFLWLILISLSFFIAGMISAPFNRQGVAIVAEWFYFKKEVVFGLSLLFWASIPLIAYLSSKSFMKLANSRNYLRTKWTRLIFLLNNILLPVLISVAIFSTLIIFAPGYNLEHYLSLDFIRFLVISLTLFFVLIFNFHKRYVGIKRTRDLEQFSMSFVIFTVIFISVFYLGLYFT